MFYFYQLENIIEKKKYKSLIYILLSKGLIVPEIEKF